MENTLIEKVRGIHLRGGPIPEEKYINCIQSKVGYEINSYERDCDCIDCGDCDCYDCPV